MGMGGGGGKPPEKSPEERELQSLQVQMLKEQRGLLSEQLRMQDLLGPLMYESAGLKPRMEGGKIVGFDKVDDSLDPMRRDIEKGFLERTQKALKGELAIDPALERGIGENRRALEDTLLQQLGPGYATSTPGMQALAEGARGAEELRTGARRGELTLSEALGLNRAQANDRTSQARLANIGSVFQAPQAWNQGSVSNLNSLAQVLQGYQTDRNMAFQMMPKKRNTAMNVGSMAATGAAAGSLFGPGYGTAIGAGAGALLGLFM